MACRGAWNRGTRGRCLLPPAAFWDTGCCVHLLLPEPFDTGSQGELKAELGRWLSAAFVRGIRSVGRDLLDEEEVNNGFLDWLRAGHLPPGPGLRPLDLSLPSEAWHPARLLVLSSQAVAQGSQSLCVTPSTKPAGLKPVPRGDSRIWQPWAWSF